MEGQNQIPVIGQPRTIQQMMEQKQHYSTNEIEENLQSQKDYHSILEGLYVHYPHFHSLSAALLPLTEEMASVSSPMFKFKHIKVTFMIKVLSIPDHTMHALIMDRVHPHCICLAVDGTSMSVSDAAGTGADASFHHQDHHI